MASRKELSIEKHSVIVALRQAGHSFRNIARLQKISVGGVQDTLKRYVDTKSSFDRSCSRKPQNKTGKINLLE